MSLSKAESARINGAKSRGPKTPAGKAISSQNAIKHGLFAEALLIHGESEEGFENFAESYMRRFEPRDDIERDIIRQMIAAMWRLARCWRLQTETLNLELVKSARAGNDLVAHAFDALIRKSPTLQLLHRFEKSYDRIYKEAMRTLINLRKNFPPPESVPKKCENEPKPPSNKLIELTLPAQTPEDRRCRMSRQTPI